MLTKNYSSQSRQGLCLVNSFLFLLDCINWVIFKLFSALFKSVNSKKSPRGGIVCNALGGGSNDKIKLLFGNCVVSAIVTLLGR